MIRSVGFISVAGGPASVPAETDRQHGAFERRGGGFG
jgi:hypothetical protein